MPDAVRRILERYRNHPNVHQDLLTVVREYERLERRAERAEARWSYWLRASARIARNGAWTKFFSEN